jgi:hypothetical protein
MSPTKEAAALCGVACGWSTWLMSHIQQINGVLQAVLLLVSIVVTLITGRYYYRRTPK